MKYGVNLVILQTFFNASEISGDLKFNEPPKINLPDLALYLDHDAKLSSKEGTINLKALRHPAEIEAERAQQFADLQPTNKGLIWYLFDWMTPVVIGNAIITSLLVLVITRMRSKLLSVTSLVLAQGQMSIAQSTTITRNWQFFQAPTASTTQKPIYETLMESLALVKEIDTVQICQLMCMVLITALLTYAIRRKWFQKYEADIYLELGTTRHRAQITLRSIPHDLGNYVVTATKSLSTVRIEGMLWPKLILDYENVAFTHRHAQVSFLLPQEIHISWLKAYMIYHTIQNQSSFYYLLFTKTQSGWNKFIPLNNRDDNDINNPPVVCDRY